MSKETCIYCYTELLPDDADPNGDFNPVCLRCRAEQEHDFDAEPRVKFDRFGERKQRVRAA